MKNHLLYIIVAVLLTNCASVDTASADLRKNDFRERWFVSAPIKPGATFTLISRTTNDHFATELSFALGQAGYIIKRNLLSTLPEFVGRQVLAKDAWLFRDEFARKLLQDKDLLRGTISETNLIQILDRYKDSGNLVFDTGRIERYIAFIKAYQTLQQQLGCDYIIYIWSSPTHYQIEITTVKDATVAAMFRVDATDFSWRKNIAPIKPDSSNSGLLLSRYAVQQRDATIRAIEYARRLVKRLGEVK